MRAGHPVGETGERSVWLTDHQILLSPELASAHNLDLGRRRGGETGSELSSVRCDAHQYVAGLPGVGKTHLAVGLGLKAIEAGYRVLFTTAAHMIAVLTKAVHESKLDDKLKAWVRMCLVSLIPFLSVRFAPDGSLP